jgi:predicted ATP-grasp superfamily ATP-dependent carboligase
VNLLVTNTRNTQAYHIIRALRPYADKVVATMEGESRFVARLSHAASSRLVDKRYYTPFPADDWRAGRIRRENTPREEAYIQVLLWICEKEKIDTIFPSFDPHVYVFSKNKERFQKINVLIPVPDYDTVITPLDKYRTILAAQLVGFPCPRTYLPENEDELRRIVDELGFPLVVKDRFNSGSRGTSIIGDFAKLCDRMRASWERPSSPMIQEYIPGKGKQQFYLVLDRQGRLKLAFCPKTHRLFDRLYRDSSAASESSIPHPYTMSAARIGQKLGWWGGITVQTKIDPRDGRPKLMEINPRLGHHLWYRTALGINEPLMCLKIARHEEIESVKKYPEGTMLLSPIEDFLGLGFWLLDRISYKLRTEWLGFEPVDCLNPPMSTREIYQSYRQTYLNGKEKLFDPYFKYFFQDPGVSILWWLKYSYQLLAASKHVGR